MPEPPKPLLEAELDKCIASGNALFERVQEWIDQIPPGLVDIGQLLRAAARVPWLEIHQEYRSWDEYNQTVLRQCFTPPAFANLKVLEYLGCGKAIGLDNDQIVPSMKLRQLHGSLGEKLRWLRSLRSTTHLYLSPDSDVPNAGAAASSTRIFIGHGRSAAWKDLEHLLTARLDLEVEEFDNQPSAGLSVKERLLQMLDACGFAFIVFTAEDEHLDGTQHARENVIHELGLTQGRYGFEKGIVLLEDGCAEMSNIHGLIQIRFPRGMITAVSEEIRRVLEREGLLQ